MMRGLRTAGRSVLATACALLAAAAAATGLADARPESTPTVRECAQLQLRAPPFRGSRAAATVFCLRPASIRTTASMSWTTCPTTPMEEACQEGRINLSFRSTASGFGSGPGKGPDSWGGENYPGAGIYSLPGTGRYRCEGYSVDRQQGRTVYARYTTTQPVRDQAAGFAVIGKSIRVATSLHPGRRGPLGLSADVRLGQPNKCILSAIPIGPDAVRTFWPGRLFSVAALGGSRTTITSSGTLARSIAVPASEGLPPGVKIQATVRWSFSVVTVSALQR
jgi:hypothetical protein